MKKIIILILIGLFFWNCTGIPDTEPDKYIWVNKQDSTEIYFHPGFVILPTFLAFCLIAQELNQSVIDKNIEKRTDGIEGFIK